MEAKSIRDPDFTKRQMMIAAKREFNSVGFFSTDTNKIAKLAGYAPGSFYRHFKDKLSIFIEVYRDWNVEHMHEIERAFSQSGSIEHTAEQLTSIIISFYGNWKIMRASARVLAVSESRIAGYRSEQRTELIENVKKLRQKMNLKPLTEMDITVFLILLERLGDAISDGELEATALSNGAGKKALFDFIFSFLEGKS